MLQEVVNSWFMLGRLGGFNSSNLQARKKNKKTKQKTKPKKQKKVICHCSASHSL
jgi:hypothetical protein